MECFYGENILKLFRLFLSKSGCCICHHLFSISDLLNTCSNQQHLLKTYFCLSNSSETGADGWYYKTFADLRPYSTYIINVTCKTDKGDGPVAEITLTTNQYGKTS